MNPRNFVAALALGAGVGLSQVSADIFSFTFDGAPTGSPANTFITGGIRFDPAVFSPEIDGFGDPIPGSDRWRVDQDLVNQGIGLTVEDPLALGYGIAPSAPNMLDARFQPTLVSFGRPLDVTDFSVVLDNSALGDLGLSEILFLADDGAVVAALGIDQTVPGLIASQGGPLFNVSSILLPAGALYDDLTINAVPEPTAPAALAALGLAAAAWWRRRRS
jgi:MYXO-CTERM domain-containing protein